MRKIVLSTLLFLTTLSLAVAQQQPIVKANYDLAAQFSPKRISKLVFSTSVEPNWFKNSDKFWYKWQDSQGSYYYIVDPATRTKKALFNNATMAARLTQIVKDPFDAQNIPITNLKLVDDSYFTFEIPSSVMKEEKSEPKKGAKATPKKKPTNKIHGFKYYFNEDRLEEIEEFETRKEYPSWGSISPDRRFVVFSRDFNLWYMDMENFEKAKIDANDTTIVEHQLTTEGTSKYGFGIGSNDIYATEKIKKQRLRAPILWSPDSKHFAIMRSDNSKVQDLWVINSLAQPRPKLERYSYQMPGEKGAPVRHLFVVDMESKSWREISVAAFKDQDLKFELYRPKKRELNDSIKHAVWQGENNGFYLTRTSRDLKRIDLCYVDLKEDSTKVVIEERMNTYVETRSPVISNGNIIWWSERDGWAHLYLYNQSGKLINRITSGEYHVEEVLAVDEAKKIIYFTANGKERDENPYYLHLYRVNFDGSGLQLLNSGNYNHTPFVSESGSLFVNNRSRVDSAPRASLIDNSGKVLVELEECDLTQLFAIGYKFPEPFNIKAADGVTDLYGVIYKPFDFDSTKLYPIIEYVYPGPQTEGVNFSWSHRMDRVDRLAQLGFIVVTVGNRGGHPSRSKFYHNFGYGNLRDYGLADKKAVVEKLAAKYKFIDIERVGIHGHSGGGFMSTAAMLRYPHFFKVAVSSAGNHENNIYNRWWSEKHHGVLESITAKGDTIFQYKIGTNSELARNLRGKLLLVTGDIDNNVHPANTYRMANALIRAGKRFDIFIMTGQRHSFGNMNEYFFWLMADYFSEHLIGDSQKSTDIIQMRNN
ncbi:MAG: DPP IV N-terminal domain-containing protein [Bacteroidales bacterium]